MPWHGYQSLPAYFGGKRKLCPIIFREIAKVHPTSTWSRLRLVDPFMGGGAVSLYGKARGFGVLCGDLAERSVIVGKALIENDAVTLTEADLLRLFVPSDLNRHWIERHHVPDTFTPEAASFLDNAFAAADEVSDPIKRDLLRLLLVKYIFSLRPHAQFRAPGAFNRPLAEGHFDDIKGTYHQAIAANAEHPLPALRRLAQTINCGVIRGAQRCQAMKAEAAETIRRGAGADILYLDPPYAGTLAYEDEYRILDGLLGESHETNAFSHRDGLAKLTQLLGTCAEYPLWVISYGNAAAGLDEVKGAVEQFRPVRAMEIAYQHLGSVASEEKRQRNRELLLLAGEGVR
jgi:site-specific DNA-adenine methylase